jgi:hypothetical protein
MYDSDKNKKEFVPPSWIEKSLTFFVSNNDCATQDQDQFGKETWSKSSCSRKTYTVCEYA